MATRGRPRQVNRAVVAEVTLSLRVSAFERAGLEELARRRSAELEDTGGTVSVNSLTRALIRRELAAHGITAAPLHAGKTAAPEAPTQAITNVPAPAQTPAPL